MKAKDLLLLLMLVYIQQARSGTVAFASGPVPFAGPAADIICGAVTGNVLTFSSGVVFLGLDFLTSGTIRKE